MKSTAVLDHHCAVCTTQAGCTAWGLCVARTEASEPRSCSCDIAGTGGCFIKGKGLKAPAGRYCKAGWEGWRY